MLHILFSIPGLLLLSFATQPLWWSSGCCQKKKSQSSSKVTVSGFGTTNIDPSESFLGPCDHDTLFKFKVFQNNPIALFMLSLPAILSLAFCPATLYLAPVIVKHVWPPEVFPMRPNVNDAISCFLTPSGLVYAIAFGFAFQEALTKQTTLATFFSERLSTLHNLLFLVGSSKTISPKTKATLLLVLKDEIMTWMGVVMKNKRNKIQQGKPLLFDMILSIRPTK